MLIIILLLTTMKNDTFAFNKKRSMTKVFLLILGLLAVAMLLFCVRILFKKNGTFHSQHIGQSKAMRDRGIHCAQATDKIEYASKHNVIDMEK